MTANRDFSSCPHYVKIEHFLCPVTTNQEWFRQEEGAESGEAAEEEVCSQVITVGDSSCARTLLNEKCRVVKAFWLSSEQYQCKKVFLGVVTEKKKNEKYNVMLK